MTGRPGSGFGALWRIRTRKHIRTTRSIPTSSGTRAGDVYWDQETERLEVEEERLEERRTLHEQRRAIQRLLDLIGGGDEK
jgi:hypothetical protein